jgi:hypothetical protein
MFTDNPFLIGDNLSPYFLDFMIKYGGIPHGTTMFSYLDCHIKIMGVRQKYTISVRHMARHYYRTYKKLTGKNKIIYYLK